MKQLNLLKTMLLLCALIVGSNAWADTEKTFDFSFETIGTTGWSNSYAAHSYEYTEGTVYFSAASKQGSNITDVPVTKGQPVEFIMEEGYTISKATFTCKQWGSKAQTITLWYSTNGGSTYSSTETTSTNFTITDNSLPSGTNAVKITFSNTNNQIGVQSVTITYSTGEIDTRTATTVEIDASGITNTNRYIGTDAGTLAATVKAGETTVGSTVTWSGNNNEVATINGSTGAVTLVAAGTVTFTATYEGDEDYKPSTKTYELTVINDNPNAITLWSEDFSGYSSGNVPSGTDYNYACSGTGTKIYTDTYAGGASPELLVNGYFSATIPLVNVEGDLTLTYKTNNTNITVSSSTEGVTLSGDTTAKGSKNTSTVEISGITADMTSVEIKFSATSNCRLDDIVLKGSLTTPATMSGKGLASFASPYPLDLADLPEGLKAYKASLATGGVVTLDEVTAAVPAGTGLILKGTANESYNIPVVKSGSALAGNLLVGVTEAAGKTVTADEAYALSKSDGKFHMVTSGLTIPQGKAYLPAGSLSAHELVLSFVDGETTAINEVKGLKADVRGEYFNLNGQRVAQPTKGLYIVNGKKVVIK